MTLAEDPLANAWPGQVAFSSILQPEAKSASADVIDGDSLHDLALDQLLDAMSTGATDGQALTEVFTHPLRDVAAVQYRQDVFSGLEHETVRSVIDRFVDALRDVRRGERDAAKSRYPFQQGRMHLSAVLLYCAAVQTLASNLLPALDAVNEPSIGLRGLADYADDIRRSPKFRRLRERARELDMAWASISFALLMRAGTLIVAPFDDEPSLEEDVERVFARFRREPVTDHRSRVGDGQSLDHVQGWVLESVGTIRQDVMRPLLEWSTETTVFVDDVLSRAAADVEFYFLFLDLIAPIRAQGLPFCYPEVSTTNTELAVSDTFDLSLARGNAEQGAVVTNDLALHGDERIFVITGPNQGGKTTTARIFGQLHHLAALGCPVAGSVAVVFLPDRVMTCFDRAEQLETLEGRMGEEVLRIRSVLDRASARSVVVLNEAFSSTALRDATAINREVLCRLLAIGSLAACVTFIDELARMDPRVVSLVAAVARDDPAVRTFRIERRDTDGRAYAEALARKYGLTHDRLLARIAGRVVKP